VPFIAAGLGLGWVGGSCWTWVPTAWGWQQVWACDNGWGGWGY
jgi:hypothetical protein